MDATPPIVTEAQERADRVGFALSCEPGVGRLLAALAAAVPPDGRILELGTGAGVGTAWLVHGLAGREDVELVTVELDGRTAAIAAAAGWWPRVSARVGDALTLLGGLGRFHLIFADAPAGKWTGLDRTIDALEPGGVLVVDDMMRQPSGDAGWHATTARIRDTLLTHPDLVGAELDTSSGIVLAVRRRSPVLP